MHTSISTTLMTGAVAAVAAAGSANADYVLQTFSGSSSASVSADRANVDPGSVTLSLGYNAIAGGASSMDVSVGAGVSGETKSNARTNASNRGTYAVTTPNWYRWYYGGNSGTTSSFVADDNYRAWSASSSSAANLSGSVLNMSSAAQYDSGIADSTKVRYTSSTYTTLFSGTTQANTSLSGDAFNAYVNAYSSLTYSAAAGQVMDLSASTGLTDIKVEGSGTSWATGGQVEFYMEDAAGIRSVVLQSISGGTAMGDLSVSISSILANAYDDNLDPGVMNLTQVTNFRITFWGDMTYTEPSSVAAGRGVIGDNGGFNYDASQVTLVGYAVPAPGALALLGAAGLVGARRRRG